MRIRNKTWTPEKTVVGNLEPTKPRSTINCIELPVT